MYGARGCGRIVLILAAGARSPYLSLSLSLYIYISLSLSLSLSIGLVLASVHVGAATPKINTITVSARVRSQLVSPARTPLWFPCTHAVVARRESTAARTSLSHVRLCGMAMLVYVCVQDRTFGG